MTCSTLPLSSFDGIAPATLQMWLTSAQTAFFNLRMGAMVAEVVTQGDVAKFTRANVGDLQALIAELQAAIAGRPTKGAIGVLWSD